MNFVSKSLGIALMGLYGLQASAQNVEPPSDIVKLIFWGDMMQHDAQIKAAYNDETGKYEYDDCFVHIKQSVEDADVAVCNFEVSLGGKPYKGYPCFSAPDEYFDAILDAGFDVFLTANNHCLDKGKVGLERTVKIMKEKDVAQMGTYLDSADRVARYPVPIDVNGIRIVMLNFTYGTNGIVASEPNMVNYIDTAQIHADIRKAKKLFPDYIIANAHWGVEYTHVPNAEQKRIAHWLIENGVDHVIGGHPHVVQPCEIVTDKEGREHFIIYSMGNVISNMSKKDCDGGVAVGLNLPVDKSRWQKVDAWYGIYHVARPVNSGLKNYVIYTTGTPEAELPAGEKARLDEFVRSTRAVMATGDAVREEPLERSVAENLQPETSGETE